MANVPISGFTVPANTVGIGATGYSLTGSANASFVDLAGTWNTSGTPTAIKLNITETGAGSNAASLLMDLQVGGTSRAIINKIGRIESRDNILAVAGGSIGFGSGNTLPVTQDIFLTRKSGANLRLGAADVDGSPVAQTLSVQSTTATTTTNNVAGANLTIQGSQGTGNAAGGSIVFQVAPAGGSGNTRNALADALTINSARQATFAGNVVANEYRGISGALILTASAYFQLNGNLGFIAGIPTSDSSFSLGPSVKLGFAATNGQPPDTVLNRDAANTLALRNGTNAQESRVYGSFVSATNFQRLSVKTLREVSTTLSGATYVSTIAIPAYAVLIGVTTRVNTAITGATTYDVGDGADVDLWGAAIPVALNSESRTANFTAVAATGAAATSRTVTLTANGSNFTGGVVEICLHYLTTEAD